jgi:hypothetical protein
MCTLKLTIPTSVKKVHSGYRSRNIYFFLYTLHRHCYQPLHGVIDKLEMVKKVFPCSNFGRITAMLT